MRLKWYRLRPAQRTVVMCMAAILLVEGLLWGEILLGKGLQQIFRLRWKQMIREVQPMQNVPFAVVINECGKAYNVDPALIAAVIRCESNFNSRAISQAGAVGLMQICLPTWQEIKKTHHEWQTIQSKEDDIQALYQPQINIAAGTIYLQSMLVRYQGDPVKAVAAYNAGPGSVDHYKGVPPYRETIRYVHHVAAVWREYRGMYGAAAACYRWGCVLEDTGLRVQIYILWGSGGIGCLAGIRHWMLRRKRRW